MTINLRWITLIRLFARVDQSKVYTDDTLLLHITRGQVQYSIILLALEHHVSNIPIQLLSAVLNSLTKGN